jgi:hypothetical protein
MNANLAKSDLLALKNAIEKAANSTTGISISLRYATEGDIRALLERGDLPGIEEIVQTTRLTIGALDCALRMVSEELCNQIRLIQAAKERE